MRRFRERRTLCFLLIALGTVVTEKAVGGATRKPNVLVIMADDCTYNDLPIYGGQNAKTPNLEKFAAGGLVFDRAYLCQAICQPCRSELFTGKYPVANGSAFNHSASRTGIESLPQLLKPHGYRVGLAGKVHVRPRSVYPFEEVPGFDQSCTRAPTRPHILDGLREFITRDPTQPFCLVVALVEPHVPWVMGDATAYPPDELDLPPNIADTPKTRSCFSRYLAEVSYMDGQVGEILVLLEKSGFAKDTLVLFTSEQGSQFPGNKWTNWNTGLHTALIASWSGRIPPGRTDALVQYADVVPTLLDLNGETTASIQSRCDGVSFAATLLEGKPSSRSFVYGLHNNVPEGPPYPIRSISDGRHRLILNLNPENTYIEKHVMGMAGSARIEREYWATWVWEAGENDRTFALVNRYLRRPAVELYDCQADPFEMTNLAGEPGLANLKNRLASELLAWMDAQGDPGEAMDTREVYLAAKQGLHPYPRRNARSDHPFD